MADHEEPTPVNGINEDLESGNVLHVDHKPRLLLMGLKRYVMALPLKKTSYADHCPQEREVVDIKRCFS